MVIEVTRFIGIDAACLGFTSGCWGCWAVEMEWVGVVKDVVWTASFCEGGGGGVCFCFRLRGVMGWMSWGVGAAVFAMGNETCCMVFVCS